MITKYILAKNLKNRKETILHIMQKFKLLLVMLCAFSLTGFSQENESKEDNSGIIRIVGKLTNKQNNQPIPFANVGVIGSYIGAASNLDGIFEFKIPGKYNEQMIQASAVGFSTFTAKVSECSQVDTLEIVLTPKNYNIGEVEVMAESLVLQKELKLHLKKFLKTTFKLLSTTMFITDRKSLRTKN